MADHKSTSRLPALLLAALVLGVAVVPCAVAAEKLMWNGEAWVPVKPPEPGTPEGDLAQIRRYLDQGLNKHAVEAAETFLKLYPEHPGAEEALNLGGQAQMNRGRYWEAYGEWFERQIALYPNGTYYMRALDREYQIAEAFLQGRKRRVLKIFRLPAVDDGIEILTRIASYAPGTELAEKALLRVADHHFDHEQYDQAIETYDEFVRQNPQSDRRPYAMLRAAKANLLSYRGVDWEITPLVEAAERFRVFAGAYPRLAARENIPGILREIHDARAHKVYHTGRFYERVKRPTAARYYYRMVLRDYPDTPWATSAEGRLDILGPGEEEQWADFTPPTDLPATAEDRPAETGEVATADTPEQGETVESADGDNADETTVNAPGETDREESPQEAAPPPIRLEDIHKRLNTNE